MSVKKVALVVMIASLFSINTTFSASNDDTLLGRMIVADFVHEMVQCSVFYSILGQGKDAEGNSVQSLAKFQGLSESLILRAADLSKDIEMKNESLIAIMERERTQMAEKINYDAVNISILMKEYGQHCKSVVENPTDRMIYWMNKDRS